MIFNAGLWFAVRHTNCPLSSSWQEHGTLCDQTRTRDIIGNDNRKNITKLSNLSTDHKFTTLIGEIKFKKWSLKSSCYTRQPRTFAYGFYTVVIYLSFWIIKLLCLLPTFICWNVNIFLCSYPQKCFCLCVQFTHLYYDAYILRNSVSTYPVYTINSSTVKSDRPCPLTIINPSPLVLHYHA